MKILTITLNAAIDATYVVPALVHGGAARTVRVHRLAGGKGNNVARVLAGQGHAVTATGFVAGAAGEYIERGLEGAGIVPAFTTLPAGESRTCHTILEAGSGVATEVLEAGPAIDRDSANRFLARLPALVAAADVVSLSGSAPPGLDEAFLRQTGNLARRCRRFVVDSSGDSLRIMLESRPDLIKPNRAELHALVGGADDLDTLTEHAQRELCDGGRRVLLSLGVDGARLIAQDGILRAASPPLRVVNTVGCGDAMLAGYLHAWRPGGSPAEALTTAVAFAAAAARQETAGTVNDIDIERFLPTIPIQTGLDHVESAAP